MDTKKTKSGLEKAPIVYVEWVDAVADAGWQEGTKTEIHRCFSIGWIVSEADDALCIANTVSMDSSNARMHIPKSWIKTRKEVDIEAIISESKGKGSPAGSKRPYNRKVRTGA
jgi:hypothetical protein